jgi:stress response protein SCP2
MANQIRYVPCFLFDCGDSPQTSHGNIDRTRIESAAFQCSQCGHSSSNTVPNFPSEEQILASPLFYPCVQVLGEGAHLLDERRLQRKLHIHHQHVSVNPFPDLPSELSEKSSTILSSKNSEDGETSNSDESSAQASTWITVSKKKRSVDRTDSIEGAPCYSCSICFTELNESSFTRSQLKKGLDRRCSHCLSSTAQPAHKASRITITPSALVGAPTVIINKNVIKREKKKAAAAAKKRMQQSDLESVTGSRFSHLDVPTTALENSLTDCDSSDSSIGEWKDVWRASSVTTLLTEHNMSHFRILNRDTAVHLLTFLESSDILHLSASCRGLDSLCDDWLVWKHLFHSKFPRSGLKPSGSNSSWKRAFILEVNCLSQELFCFNSRVTKNESILGFPLWFTTNPRTGCLDYATSTFDIMSYDSYSKDMIRRTVWGEKFTHFLPMYLDEEHFQRGLGILISVSREIIMKGISQTSQQKGGRGRGRDGKQDYRGKGRPGENVWMPRSDPEMVLTLLTKMMNTQVVLLCDKGIAASEVALIGYCQLHRLLLAVIQTFPELKFIVRQRLDDFARKPETRVKRFTPSLGELLTLLSVSDTYGWDQLAMAYLKECFDRSVLWACTKDPSLATVTPGDVTRLEKYLETQRVSLRLTLFHAVFLRMLVHGGGSVEKLERCIDRYDTFHVRPTLCLRREWQQVVQQILQFNTWPQFFEISRIPLPTKSQLLFTLETAVNNSLAKGYHSHDTKFENVMKSGVSQILLKGETYSAPPNISKIQMLEKWRFDAGTGAGHVVFLDASCLVYDFSDQHVGTVDYNHTTWSGAPKEMKITRVGSFTYTSHPLPPVSIQHSGDVIDHTNGIGKHTIDINLKKLPNTVQSLFFTVSAWNTTLKEISQPSAHLFDTQQHSGRGRDEGEDSTEGTGTELCSYQLQDHDRLSNTKTAVIMCRLFRPTLRSRWELVSIGNIGYGRAGNYESILKDIAKYLKTTRNSNARKGEGNGKATASRK